MEPVAAAEIASLLERLWREQGRTLRAALLRRLRDLELVDDAVAEAFAAALASWPSGGVPERPIGWLVATGARRAIDALRRRACHDAWPGGGALGDPLELAPLRSAPAQNARPAPRTITTRRSRCWSNQDAACASSSSMVPFMALSRSGRFKVRNPSSPSVSMRRVSNEVMADGALSLLGRWCIVPGRW